MSGKLVTGDALNEILISVKEYIDLKEFGFEEADLSDIESEVPKLTLTEYTIKDKEVDNVIDKYFKKDE